MIKYTALFEKNFSKKNIKYLLLFIIVEFAMILIYGLIEKNNNILLSISGVYKFNFIDFDTIYFLIKLFPVLFLLFINYICFISNYRYSFGYLKSRISSSYIFLSIIIQVILNVIFANVILLILGCITSYIYQSSMEFSFVSFFVILLEVSACLALNLINIKKYKYFSYILLFIIYSLFILDFVFINILIFIFLCCLYFFKIKITCIENVL